MTELKDPMPDPKMTIDLPFSPEDVRAGRVHKAGQEETGWVIEHWDSEPSRPKYFAGKEWSYDNLKAIRFAREQDALAMSHYMFPGDPNRIADHMWCP